LQRINLKFDSQCSNEEFKKLTKTFKKLPALKEIDVSLPECSNGQTQEIQLITRLLKRMVKIKSICLRFRISQYQVPRDLTQNLQSLCLSFEKLKILEGLHLDFSSCPRINKDSFLKPVADLGKIPSLTNLAFTFSFSPLKLKHLSQSLPPMKNVQSLCLSFSVCSCLSDDFLVLGQGFSHFPALKCLTMKFEECVWVGDWLFTEFIQELELEKNSNLETLSLNFLNSQLTNISFYHLSEILPTLIALKKIDLNLSGVFGISQQGLLAILEALKKLPSLKSLQLDFNICYSINYKGYHSIIEAFSTLNSLQELKIRWWTDFQGYFETDKNWSSKSAENYLEKNFAQIEKNFPHFFQTDRIAIKKERFVDLCQKLKNKNNLKTLPLRLVGIKINNKGLHAVIKVEKDNFRNLRQLSFQFFFSDYDSSEKVFNAYKRFMRNLSNLTQIDLSL